MFKRLLEGHPTVRVTIDGRTYETREGETVAAAMLAIGIDSCRTTALSGAPRAPYCMMGACFDCLVSVDGVGNRQGCLVRVKEGMVIASQQGRRVLGQ